MSCTSRRASSCKLLKLLFIAVAAWHTTAFGFPIDEFKPNPVSGSRQGLVVYNAETRKETGGTPYFVDDTGEPHFRKYSLVNQCGPIGGFRTLVSQTCPMMVVTEPIPNDPYCYDLPGFCHTSNPSEDGEGISSCYSPHLSTQTASLNPYFLRFQIPGTGSPAGWVVYDGDSNPENLNLHGLKDAAGNPGVNLYCGGGTGIETEVIDYRCPKSQIYWDQGRFSNYCRATPIFTITVFDIFGNRSSATATIPEFRYYNEVERNPTSWPIFLPYGSFSPSGSAPTDFTKIGAIQVMWETGVTKRGLPFNFRDKSSLRSDMKPLINEAFNLRYLRTNGGTTSQCTQVSCPGAPTPDPDCGRCLLVYCGGSSATPEQQYCYDDPSWERPAGDYSQSAPQICETIPGQPAHAEIGGCSRMWAPGQAPISDPGELDSARLSAIEKVCGAGRAASATYREVACRQCIPSTVNPAETIADTGCCTTGSFPCKCSANGVVNSCAQPIGRIDPIRPTTLCSNPTTGGFCTTATPTATVTATVTVTATMTATITPTMTLTSTPSPTWTFVPTRTFTPTLTATASPTGTSTPTTTVTSTATASPTVTLTTTGTPPPTSTATMTATSTHTPTNVPTLTMTATSTATSTATATTVSTSTPTSTATATGTGTALAPPVTHTPTPSHTPTSTAVGSAVPTATATATATAIARTCEEFSAFGTQLRIDSTALRQRNLIKKQVAKALNAKLITSKVSKSLVKEADAIYKDLWGNIWAYPRTVTLCNNIAGCIKLSYESRLVFLDRRSGDNLKLVTKFLSSIKNKKTRAKYESLLKDVTALTKLNLDQLKLLPRESVECSGG